MSQFDNLQLTIWALISSQDHLLLSHSRFISGPCFDLLKTAKTNRRNMKAGSICIVNGLSKKCLTCKWFRKCLDGINVKYSVLLMFRQACTLLNIKVLKRFFTAML